MAKQGFYPRRAGYLQVLNGGEMLSVCDAVCQETKSRLGIGYKADARRGKVRIHGRVSTANKATYYAERATHRLRNTKPRMAHRFGGA